MMLCVVCTMIPVYVTLASTVALLHKHHRIILNYYVRYLSGFDAQLMRNVVLVSTIITWGNMISIEMSPVVPWV